MTVTIKRKDAKTFDIASSIKDRDGRRLRFQNVIFTCETIEDGQGNTFFKRKKGRWIDEGDCYRCSECGAAYGWWINAGERTFCRYCGTELMEEES